MPSVSLRSRIRAPIYSSTAPALLGEVDFRFTFFTVSLAFDALEKTKALNVNVSIETPQSFPRPTACVHPDPLELRVI